MLKLDDHVIRHLTRARPLRTPRVEYRVRLLSAVSAAGFPACACFYRTCEAYRVRSLGVTYPLPAPPDPPATRRLPTPRVFCGRRSAQPLESPRPSPAPVSAQCGGIHAGAGDLQSATELVRPTPQRDDAGPVLRQRQRVVHGAKRTA